MGFSLAAATLGAAGIGAIGGILGGNQTNKSNEGIASARNAMEIAEAQKARDFSAGESKINRAFQAGETKIKRDYDERMSSTAVQRRMEDMKKAGINPILAGKYDASSPSAAAASGSIGPTAKANAHGYTAINKIGKGIEGAMTALQMKKTLSDINFVDANTKLTNRKTDLTNPINRMMDIVDNIIQGASGSVQSYKREAANLREDLIELKKYATGENRDEAEKIRKSPGIQLTPGAKEQSNKHKSKNYKRGYRDYGN